LEYGENDEKSRAKRKAGKDWNDRQVCQTGVNLVISTLSDDLSKHKLAISSGLMPKDL